MRRESIRTFLGRNQKKKNDGIGFFFFLFLSCSTSFLSPPSKKKKRQPPGDQKQRTLSLLCWSDLIPRQPEGGIFDEGRQGKKKIVVDVDLKTLSLPTLALSSPSPSPSSPSPLLSSSPQSPSLDELLQVFRVDSRDRPRLVDVCALGKAGRVPSATRVVVVVVSSQESPSASEAGSSSSINGSNGTEVGIGDGALSVVLSGALVEKGSVILPAGTALPLCVLQVADVEPAGAGACRIVRSTRVERKRS